MSNIAGVSILFLSHFLTVLRRGNMFLAFNWSVLLVGMALLPEMALVAEAALCTECNSDPTTLANEVCSGRVGAVCSPCAAGNGYFECGREGSRWVACAPDTVFDLAAGACVPSKQARQLCPCSDTVTSLAQSTSSSQKLRGVSDKGSWLSRRQLREVQPMAQFITLSAEESQRHQNVAAPGRKLLGSRCSVGVVAKPGSSGPQLCLGLNGNTFTLVECFTGKAAAFAMPTSPNDFVLRSYRDPTAAATLVDSQGAYELVLSGVDESAQQTLQVIGSGHMSFTTSSDTVCLDAVNGKLQFSTVVGCAGTSSWTMFCVL